MNTLTIKDESAAGDILHKIALQFENEYITVEELIKARIVEEVKRYETNLTYYRNGLVRPSNLENRINNKTKPKIDIEKQLYIALDAFLNNGFILLVDDEQVEHPEDKILVDASTEVSFIKLTPLVGG
jgi:hypothetical protein